MTDSRWTAVSSSFGPSEWVVTNVRVGDVTQIISQHRIGVLYERPELGSISKAPDEFGVLLADPELGSPCRAAAEEVFSLEAGTEAYRRLYAEILEAEQA